MIITPAAIAYGCLSLLALLLSSGLLVAAVHALRKPGAAADRGSGFVLVLALGQAALVVRLLAWPALYAMFGSYVGLIKGSMCLYGVTQSIPPLTRSLEVLEPLSFLIAGATLFLLGAYRAGARALTGRALLAHLALAALLALAASIAGLAFLLAPKATQEVSCCSAVTDTGAASQGPSGLLIVGPLERLVLPLTQSLALALFFLQVWQVANPSRRRALAAAPLALALLAGALLSLFGPISPVLTGMASHHCAYCLVAPRNAPGGLGVAGFVLLALATCAPIWLAWLAVATGEEEEPRRRTLRLAGLGAVALFWALVLVPFYMMTKAR
jgi:hypothetical protein